MSGSGVKASILSRSGRILGMAARVAGHEARHKVRSTLSNSLERLSRQEIETRIAQAKAIAETLGQLKGAAMKAGQLLSLDASDILPPEASDILAKLQGRAEPVDFEILHRVLHEDLGEKASAIETLDPEPAASASIGQVHRASIDGQSVAVKIQYPGIGDSIDSDLAMLERLADSWLTLTRSQIDLSEMFDEIRIILHLEADYVRERENLEEYGRLLESHPQYVVPRPLPEYCGPRVLTMSWEDGIPLQEWIKSNPSTTAREAFGHAALGLYCLEFFDWGFVQTDPNPANFLVRPKTRELVLLDFGATLRYDESFRAEYVELLRTVATKDRGRIIQSGIDFDLLDAREGKETRALFADMMLSAAEPLEAASQPFRFGDGDYAERSQRVLRDFVKSLEFSPPPRRLLFLHRKLGGVFQLLRRLDVRMDLSPYWRRMLTHRVDPAPLTPQTLQTSEL